MHEDETRRLILTFENYISQTGVGPEALRSAQSRGWLDQNGRATEAGIHLCRELQVQVKTRSALRNIA